MIIVILSIFVCITGLFLYNSIIGKKNEVKNAEGGLDAQLKQRYDLIPNLVSAVKTYMTHEAALLEKIVDLRNKASAPALGTQEKQALNTELSKKLSQFIVNVEQYPDLKASANFMSFQNSLYEIEQHISASRRFYNSAVTDYNNAREMFPSNIMAKLMNLPHYEVFNLPEMEKASPKVSELFTPKAS